MSRTESYEDYMRANGLGRYRSESSRYETAESTGEWTLGKILLIALAIILPPLAVLIKHGFRLDFWINLVLTIFFYLPGQVHAIWSILKRS